MVEYIIRTDKPVKFDIFLNLNGIHHYSVRRLEKHGRLIDVDELGYRTITDHNLEGHNVVDLEDIENAPTVLEASNGSDN